MSLRKEARSLPQVVVAKNIDPRLYDNKSTVVVNVVRMSVVVLPLSFRGLSLTDLCRLANGAMYFWIHFQRRGRCDAFYGCPISVSPMPVFCPIMRESSLL